MNRLIAIAGAVVVLAAVVALYFEKGYIRLNYPDGDEYPVRGIDVSHHQSVIDWDLLTRADLDFAFIKATEGGDHKDTKFEENWKRAGDIGLARGAYHFFTFCKSGREQALNFIETVPVEDKSLPPIIDLEYGGNCSARPPKEEVIKELEEFTKLVEARYGKTPVIYATNQSYRDFIAGELPGHKIWIRGIYSKPSLNDGRDWSFWQYTHKGRLLGVDGFVDLNVYNGSREEFKALVDGTGGG
jgi:lysozyme